MPKNFKLYNTLTREKQDFTPITAGKVGMYVCGITPYDHSHIGHARAYVVFDTLYRFLKHNGWDVKYVRNFTNVDDKIINRANELAVSPGELAQKFINSYHEDMQALNVLNPDVEPTVTGSMQEIIVFVDDLIKKGVAYVTKSGDVNYNIKKCPNIGDYTYGKLSGKNLEDLQAGARVEVGSEKLNSGDFALWKVAKAREPSWNPAEFGATKFSSAGRPGWHIECSAMSKQHLGETFDIHGGGEDLQFPHHENEIAQSCGAHDKPYVNYWLHNGFITVNGEKMSKSLGNFTLIKDVLNNYPAEALRLFILNSHYRKPVDFSDEAIASAKSALDSLYITLAKAKHIPVEATCQNSLKWFNEAMADDLHTPQALAVVYKLQKCLNNSLSEGNDIKASRAKSSLMQMIDILGILQQDPDEYLKGGMGDESAEIEEKLQEWQSARTAKDFATADSIRDEMLAKNIIFEVTKDGVNWRKK